MRASDISANSKEHQAEDKIQPAGSNFRLDVLADVEEVVRIVYEIPKCPPYLGINERGWTCLAVRSPCNQ